MLSLAKGPSSSPADDTGCRRIRTPAQVQQRPQRVGKEEEKLKREKTGLTGRLK